MNRQRFWFWDKRTKLLNEVRVVVDFTDPSTNRSSATLEVKDVSQGANDTITIETSDTGNYTWTEGTDFTATSKERTTAEAIAEAINDTTNFTAEALTGHPDNIFVYVHYTASGHITSAYSEDTGAWAFYEVNATNGTIRTVYADDSSTIQAQPLFTNKDGFLSFWLADGSGKFDLDPYKGGVPRDETYYTSYTP